MKQLLLIPFLTATIMSFGQTNVIALKSHAGNDAFLANESDNFGLPSNTIDSIYYVGNDCILQVSHYFNGYYNRDTICDPYVFTENDFDLKKIKQMYGSHVVFVGFENYEGKTSNSKKSRRSKGAIPLIILFILGVGYFFRKQKSFHLD